MPRGPAPPISMPVAAACTRCRMVKLKCNAGRPCQRCIQTGHAAECLDHVPRPRGRRPKGASKTHAAGPAAHNHDEPAQLQHQPVINSRRQREKLGIPADNAMTDHQSAPHHRTRRKVPTETTTIAESTPQPSTTPLYTHSPDQSTIITTKSDLSSSVSNTKAQSESSASFPPTTTPITSLTIPPISHKTQPQLPQIPTTQLPSSTTQPTTTPLFSSSLGTITSLRLINPQSQSIQPNGQGQQSYSSSFHPINTQLTGQQSASLLPISSTNSRVPFSPFSLPGQVNPTQGSTSAQLRTAQPPPSLLLNLSLSLSLRAPNYTPKPTSDLLPKSPMIKDSAQVFRNNTTPAQNATLTNIIVPPPPLYSPSITSPIFQTITTTTRNSVESTALAFSAAPISNLSKVFAPSTNSATSSQNTQQSCVIVEADNNNQHLEQSPISSLSLDTTLGPTSTTLPEHQPPNALIPSTPNQSVQ